MNKEECSACSWHGGMCPGHRCEEARKKEQEAQPHEFF